MSWLLAILLAATLPSFEEFRAADRGRRESRQWQSDESARLLRVDPALVTRVADKQRDYWNIQWGAAELLEDWKQKQPRFEAALAKSGSNVMVALRFACAAAEAGQSERALKLLEHCQQQDATNRAPWLVELWVLREMGDADRFEPTGAGPQYRDGADEAARARIRVLEVAGYSKYAARRVGFLPKMHTLRMAQDLRRGHHEGYVSEFLLETARAMQTGATFLVEDLVGQSLESAMWERQTSSPGKETRIEELAVRRASLTKLVQQMEPLADTATEEEMVRYYDNLLLIGEVEAMKRLAREVRSSK